MIDPSKVNLDNNYHYGMIGNCQTGALINRFGSIDWCCLPDFNSFSVFAKLLDKKKGGSFSVQSAESYNSHQEYVPGTNLLSTRFKSKSGEFEVIDFMPRYKTEHNRVVNPPEIIRYLNVLKGKPKIKIDFNPKLCYAKGTTKRENHREYIKSYSHGDKYESCYLYSDLDLDAIIASQEIVLKQDSFLMLSYNEKLAVPTLRDIYIELEKTKVYWLNWSHQTVKFSAFNDEIERSALSLKMLTYQRSGGILAALTTSLPESVGEVRNWDYRYCWIRDASMTISVLTRTGHFSAAFDFLNYILRILPYKDEKIQIMYGINGERKLTEQTLTHLSGYLNSKPVRTGNGAYMQKQNDVYGILLDMIHMSFERFHSDLTNIEDLWTIVRTLVRNVQKNWKKPDRGIWELRTSKQHFVFSKLLCWVAFDRGVKIAHLLGREKYVQEWDELREQIRKDIHKKGWNAEIGAFTQYYGSSDMDASNLLLADYGFIDPKDPKYVSTVVKTRDALMKDGLMYRYTNADDFGKPTSSFTVCSFWMIHALYKIGNTDEAEKLFERILSYSNHLGLFGEDIDFKSKRQLGNFPQAYSHLALIDTAITISSGKKLKARDRLSNYFEQIL